MEISYKNSCSEKISLCWKWTERNFKSGGRLKGILTEVGKAQLEAQSATSATSAIVEVALRFNFLF